MELWVVILNVQNLDAIYVKRLWQIIKENDVWPYLPLVKQFDFQSKKEGSIPSRVTNFKQDNAGSSPVECANGIVSEANTV